MKFNCPNCGSLLEEGHVEVHGTPLGFIFIGFSYQNLYFKAKDKKEIKVLESRCSAPALKCTRCDILIMMNATT